MDTDRWLARKKKERAERIAQLERVLLRIEVHGASAMHEPETALFVRWTAKHWQDAYRQIEVTPHSPGCACWDCVLRLHGEAARHQAERAIGAQDGSPW